MKLNLWLYLHIFLCSFVSLSGLAAVESIWSLSDALRLAVFCSLLLPFYICTKGWFVKKGASKNVNQV